MESINKAPSSDKAPSSEFEIAEEVLRKQREQDAEQRVDKKRREEYKERKQELDEEEQKKVKALKEEKAAAEGSGTPMRKLTSEESSLLKEAERIERKEKILQNLKKEKAAAEASGTPMRPLTEEESRILYGDAANGSGRESLKRDEAEKGPKVVVDYTEKLNEREKVAYEQMREFLLRGFYKGLKDYRELEKERDVREVALTICEKNINLKYPGDPSRSRDPARDRLAKEVKKVDDNIEELAFSSPENFAVVKGLEFKKLSKEVKSGKMAATPSVERHLKQVKDDVKRGKPIFIHGHLGSGKTELAIRAAREAAMESAAIEAALFETELACLEKPMSDNEKDVYRAKVYRKSLNSFKKALDRKGNQSKSPDKEGGETKEGEKRESAYDRFNPIIISGSKDLTTQDLFTSKDLKVVKIDNKSISESRKELDEEMAIWEKEHPRPDGSDPRKLEEWAREYRLESIKILELYRSKNEGFGTEVDIIAQAIYKGVIEGRPVIIDEVNAIPTAILISLNDILSRRPGETCYIPKVGPTVVKPGFSIIMTGNLSSANAEYYGTEKLNPAFLSRLDKLEHGYLPMSTVGELEDQSNPEDNELFQVMLAYLADEQGDLDLPDIEESLRKLFKLAQLARLTCLIFEGNWQESAAAKSRTGDQMEAPKLVEAVLSIRNLLEILEKWKKGEYTNLDEALWDGFIATITDPDDQRLIIGLARDVGLFDSTEGWEFPEKFPEVPPRGRLIGKKEVLPDGSYYTPFAEMETYSIYKVLEVMYGKKVPVREIYPDLDALERDEIKNEADDEFGPEDEEIFEREVAEVLDSIKALKVLAEQCGCNNDGEQN